MNDSERILWDDLIVIALRSGTVTKHHAVVDAFGISSLGYPRASIIAQILLSWILERRNGSGDPRCDSLQKYARDGQTAEELLLEVAPELNEYLALKDGRFVINPSLGEAGVQELFRYIGEHYRPVIHRS